MAKLNTCNITLNDYEKLILEALEGNSVSVRSRIDSGRSGASVFFVLLEDGTPHLAILKVQQLQDGQAKEVEKYVQACSTAARNGFENKIPKILQAKVIGDCYGVLYSIAANTHLYSKTLTQVVKGEMIDYLTSGSSEIADFIWNWNQPHSMVNQSILTALSCTMGHRFMDEKMLSSFMKLKIENTPEIVFTGIDSIFPNPIYYLKNPGLLNKIMIDVLLGLAHGDLHGDNIIISDREEIAVIDFGELMPSTNVFYDSRYLEIHLLMDILAFNSVQGKEFWKELCKGLTKKAGGLNIPNGKRILSDILPFLRTIITKNLDKATLEIYEPSFFLAGVAAGLNFMRKTQDPDKAIAAYIYVAYNLKAILQHQAVGGGFKPLGNHSVISWISEPVYKDFETLEEVFNSPTYKPVLIMGPKLLNSLGYPSDAEISARLMAIETTGISSELEILDKSLQKCNSSALTVTELKERLSLEIVSKKPNEDIDSKIKNLFAPYWQSIFTWGISTDLYERVIRFDNKRNHNIAVRSQGNKIIHHNDCPWIYLRGDLLEPSSLVLGRSEWMNYQTRNQRGELIHQILSGFNGIPIFVFAGFDKTELQLILDEIRGHVADARCIIISEYMELVEGWSKPDNEYIQLTINEIFQSFSRLKRDSDYKDTGDIKITFKNKSGNLLSVEIPKIDFERMSRHLEILDDNTIENPAGNEKEGDFYLGYQISWWEIKNDFDIRREQGISIERQVVSDLLEEHPYRINISAEPGAGSTTLVRRIAWNVYTLHRSPVVIIHSFSPSVLEDIRNLYTRINRSILVVADEDYITLEEADRLFNLLQAERIPVVMMRVTHVSQWGAETNEGRSHYIKDDLTSIERRLIRSKLKNYVTEPVVLNKLDNDYSTLLIWMLTAFEKDFIGLDKYVHDMLKFEHLTPIDKLILEFVTISLFFTKKALPYSFLADTFNLNDIVVSQEQKLELLKGNLNPLFNRLLISKKTADGEVGIATRHDLICEKMLELLVGDKWKTEVANAICKIINNIPDDGPGRGSAIQFCYTLVRAEAGNAINALGRPIRVSWLVEFMVKHSCPGLEKVFRECKEKYFPLEPHLIAHLGRFYYEFTFDYEKARMIMNEALAVDGEDSTINQMMGMTYRREIQKRIRDKCDDFSHLKSLYVVAREWFLAAASYRKDKEDHKAYGGFIQTALDLIRYGLRIKAITINSEDYHEMLSQAREMIEEAKFYLAYDEKTPLGLMEEQIRVFECDADLEKLRELAFGCGAYNGAKLVYGSVCYYDAMSHPANSIKREGFLRSLIKDLELINVRPLSSQLTLLWAKASLRLSNPDLEKIEIELSKITEERLDVQFYLMCTRFMLMLINPNIVLFNAYKKSKASCIRLSELIPWKAMRREAIGVNMNLISHKEDRDFDQSGEINDLIVLRVNRYEVRPFAGFQEAIIALRPKDPTQYIVEGDRVKGSIGFTFVGPRLYAYERA